MSIIDRYWNIAVAITGAYFERSRTVNLADLEGPNISEEEYYDLQVFCSTHSFEAFIEIFPEQFSHELDIPVDDIYEVYINLKNSYDEKLRWNDLLRKEVK